MHGICDAMLWGLIDVVLCAVVQSRLGMCVQARGLCAYVRDCRNVHARGKQNEMTLACPRAVCV